MEHRILKALNFVLQELRDVSDVQMINSFDYCISCLGQDILDQLEVDTNPVYWDSKTCAKSSELAKKDGRII